MDTPYEELDDWDDRPLREWMHQHTRDQGVIDLWEFLVGARVHDRRLVRPLGLRQPLRAQDALLRDAHGRLLVLARARAGTASSRTCATRSIEHGGEVRLGTPRGDAW